MPGSNRKPSSFDVVGEEESPGWLMTYADLVTLLLVFFVMLFSISTLDLVKFKAIAQQLSAYLAEHDPVYVSLDHAVTYVRALHTSAIGDGSYNPQTGNLILTLTGDTDLETSVTLFLETEDGNGIREMTVDVPPFEGATQVDLLLP